MDHPVYVAHRGSIVVVVVVVVVVEHGEES